MKTRLSLVLSSIFYLLCHHTYLAGVPLLKELSAFILIGAICFWFTDGLFRSKNED